MPMVADQEKGHLYRAENPSFHKGETGKGANVQMSAAHGNKGTNISIGNDKSIGELKRTWNKALSAASRFKGIFNR